MTSRTNTWSGSDVLHLLIVTIPCAERLVTVLETNLVRDLMIHMRMSLHWFG
jgi:hypothetical protein